MLPPRGIKIDYKYNYTMAFNDVYFQIMHLFAGYCHVYEHEEPIGHAKLNPMIYIIVTEERYEIETCRWITESARYYYADTIAFDFLRNAIDYAFNTALTKI